MVEWNSNPTAPTNNAVPEPSEWAAMGLLGAGLLGLVVKGRKKAVQHFVCKLSSLGQLTGGLLSPLVGSGRFFQAAIRH